MLAWHPVLEGELKDRALSVVEACARAIVSLSASPRHHGLASGDAGIALFLAYAAKALPDRGFEDAAESAWDRATEAISHGLPDASLFSGFLGVGWVTEHLRTRLFDGEGDDPNDGVDEALAERLDQRLDEHFELLLGLAGYAVYALERPSERARESLGCIVRRLDEMAEVQSVGRAWRTPPRFLLPPFVPPGGPKCDLNLGVAHGNPAVIAAVACALSAGVEVARSRRLLDDAVAWLLAQELPRQPIAFGYNVGDPRTPRAAWCYGDPGVVSALTLAARAAGRSDWLAEARRLALHSVLLPADGWGVEDAALCHGASGLALIYQRLWHVFDEPQLLETARALYRMALELHQEGTGVGGYRAWGLLPSATTTRTTDLHDVGWVDDDGFLTGAAGIGLALLAGATSVEPAWDRCLFLSASSVGR
jgi:hypothetical protein